MIIAMQHLPRELLVGFTATISDLLLGLGVDVVARLLAASGEGYESTISFSSGSIEAVSHVPIGRCGYATKCLARSTIDPDVEE